MTNLTTKMVAGPVIGSYISKDKGGFTNKTKCAAEQFGNNAITAGSALLTFGATGATVRALQKRPQAITKIAGAMDKVIKKVAVASKNKTVIKFAKKLLNASAKNKVFGALGLAAAGILYFIDHNHSYKMGQIDQKYTDRANIAA